MVKSEQQKNGQKKLRITRSKRRFLRKATVITFSLLWMTSLTYIYFDQISAQLKFYADYSVEKTFSLLINAGFAPDKVMITGNKVVRKTDILKFIDKSYPSIFISLSKLKHNIMKENPWIKEIAVRRILPNEIYIDIIEYQPFAIWCHGNNRSIIDDNGYVITDGNKGDLIEISGNEALSDLQFVKQVLSEDSELKSHIISFDRVGNRRWNLVFRTGLEAKLPENHPTSSWHYLKNLYLSSSAFLNWKVIDMRIPDKIYIKK